MDNKINENKIKDLEIIQKYSKLKSINEICRKIEYDRANIVSGRAPEDKISQVANICKVELIKVYNDVFLGVQDVD